MKKRFLSILLVLAVLAAMLNGCGETATQEQSPNAPSADYTAGELLKEKLRVPDSVQGEFVSESGISRVSVAASVTVPEVSKVDVVEAVPRTFTDDEILGMTERHRSGLDWRYAESGEPYTDGLPTKDGDSVDSDVYRLWICVDPEVSPDNTYKSFSAVYWLNARTGELSSTPTMEYIEDYERAYASGSNPVPLTDGKAADCTISLEEAIAFANEEVHAILPDYQLTRSGQSPVMEMGGFGYEEHTTPQYYLLQYTRHLNGVPVNHALHTAPASEYGYVSGTGEVFVLVADDGVLGVTYENPYDVGAVIEEDVALLPFSDIWDIFSKISLLSIQYLEANEGLEKNEAEVTEIRLGYMSVLQADGTYHYIPVWDFYAYRVLDGHGGYGGAPDPAQQIFLTVNAIDGTVIDRKLGY